MYTQALRREQSAKNRIEQSGLRLELETWHLKLLDLGLETLDVELPQTWNKEGIP
jgi:hypothetical protein